MTTLSQSNGTQPVATRATQLITDTLERLAKETDEARFSAEMTRYFQTMARFHRYSPGNVLLILLQRRTATLVAGFHRWLELGRCVKKGEKGLLILAPIRCRPAMRRKTAEQDEPEDATSATPLRFRGVYVFDIAQTEVLPGKEDGIPHLDWSVGGDHEASYQRLLTVATTKGILVEWAQLDPGHYGTSFGGRVELSDALRDDSGHRCLVLAHELAHELLHKQERSQPRAQRELEAEATAYVVGQYLGIESLNAPRYAALYGGTAEAIRATITAVSKAAGEVIRLLAPHEADPVSH